jgi:hypothetical protein
LVASAAMFDVIALVIGVESQFVVCEKSCRGKSLDL